MGCICSQLSHWSLFGVNPSSSSSEPAQHQNSHNALSTSILNGGNVPLVDGANNIFPVLNVDDLGRHISPGKLEVTETDLVLYIASKTPLTWPLRCLRRYGYENDLFSFESGRRCPTGPGIYAFKCNRAQSLFNLLQAKIQNNPASTNTTITLPPPPPPPALPTSTSHANTQGHDGGDDSESTTPGSTSPTFDYVNIAESRSSTNFSAVISNTLSDRTSEIIVGATESSDNNHPLYVNIDSQNKTSNGTSTSKSTVVNSGRRTVRPFCNGATSNSNVQNEYLNFPCRTRASVSTSDNDPGPSCSSLSPSSLANLYTNILPTAASATINNGTSSQQKQPVTEINYAELDLKPTRTNQSSSFRSINSYNYSYPSKSDIAPSNSQQRRESELTYVAIQPQNHNNNTINNTTTHNPSPSEALGYATIDFDRTAALGNVTRSKIKLNFSNTSTDKDEDGGSSSSWTRKTRHNSTAL